MTKVHRNNVRYLRRRAAFIREKIALNPWRGPTGDARAHDASVLEWAAVVVEQSSDEVRELADRRSAEDRDKL